MLTVACVYWKGKFRKREELYDETWVLKLRNMVERNLIIPHRFVCLSNVDIPGLESPHNSDKVIPLIHDWKGYWSKIELFRPGLFEDRVLYLDLDVLIVGDLSEIVNSPHPITILKGNGTKRRKEGKWLLGKYNSSVMVWEKGVGELIYKSFLKKGPEKMMNYFMGDQEFITVTFKWLATFPERWIKKLKDCPKYEPMEDMKIALCMLGKRMYGKNKRALAEFPWVKEVWK